jgi:glycerol uptake facilitator-like aquaporin
MQKLIAELLGTFALVFAGTGAIVIDQVSGGVVTHVGVALTFGLIVLAMIYTFGDVSGAHFNPAVTIGFWSAGRMPGREVLPYLGSQVIGALLASIVLRMLFPANPLLGATLPSGSNLQSFVLEFILTFFLMLTISECLDRGKGEGDHRRHRGRRNDWPGGDVCRADLRCVHESRAFAGPRCRFRPPGNTSGCISSRRLWAPIAARFACLCTREQDCC